MSERHEEEREAPAAFVSRKPNKNELSEVEAPTTQVVHDPVCHRDFPANQSRSSVEYEGFTYYFCSDACRKAFDASPAEIVEAETAYTHSEPAPPMKEVPRPIV